MIQEKYFPDPCSILFISASDNRRETLKGVFDPYEFKIHTADTMESALRIIDDMSHRKTGFDAYLLEPEVPQGPEIVKAILQQNQRAIISLFIDDSDRALLPEYITHGVIGYIPRENYEETLPAKIRDILPYRVLMIDDTDVTRDMIKAVLNQENIKVSHTNNGTTGYMKCKEMRDRKTMYDLVIIDVSMPDLDGPATLDMIRGYVPDARAIMLTSHSEKHVIEASAKRGAKAFIKKDEIDRMEPLLKKVLKRVLPKRIMIVDDSDLIRNSLRGIIESADYRICGEAEDGIYALEIFKILRPDGIILDVTMKEMDGITALKNIRQYESANPPPPGSPESALIIMHTVSDEKDDINMSIQHGVDDYLIKGADDEVILKKLAEDFKKKYPVK